MYLAMGDSIAAGAGATDTNGKSYVGLLAEAFKQHVEGGTALNRAAGGATTEDLIARQLPEVIEAIREKDVRLITITIGGNDLNVIQASPDAPTCIADVHDPKCPVLTVLVGTEERLDSILSQLEEAGPEVPIAIQLYPNLFSGTGHPFEEAAEQAFGELNKVIERVAAEHDVLIADPRAQFDGRAGELTHTLDPTPDFHPNDAGYAVIAGAFLEVLGLPDE